jgi:tRNA G18 (ribose-2'-O)-methylase SpoU
MRKDTRAHRGNAERRAPSDKPAQTATRGAVSRRPEQDPTELVYGLRACMAVFRKRRHDIRRLAFARELRDDLDDLPEWATQARVDWREEPGSELDRLAQSNQHEGVVMLTVPRRWLKPKDLASLLLERRGVAIALDRVRNPQNIGAVLRSAAFFGVDAALLGAPAPDPGLSPFAVRVAEGGAEHVELSRTTDLAQTLATLRARGVTIIGGDSHADTTLSELEPARPCVIVFGHEREGLGSRIRAECDQLVEIKGTGAVESLNVGVAAGIFIARVIPRPSATPRVSGGLTPANPPRRH